MLYEVITIEELTESSQVSARPLALDRETLLNQEKLSFLVAQLEGVITSYSIHYTKLYEVA